MKCFEQLWTILNHFVTFWTMLYSQHLQTTFRKLDVDKICYYYLRNVFECIGNQKVSYKYRKVPFSWHGFKLGHVKCDINANLWQFELFFVLAQLIIIQPLCCIALVKHLESLGMRCIMYKWSKNQSKPYFEERHLFLHKTKIIAINCFLSKIR